MILQNNNPYIEPSFSIGNRVMRVIWSTFYLLFFRISPRPFHAWRAFILRLFGAQLGKHVHVYPSVKIWAPWNLIIGDYVGIGNDAILYSMGTITIGDHTVVSQGTHLCTGSHDYNSFNFQLITAPIHIGSRVWLCTDSFVGPGVRIADGNVIAARALVSKSLSEPWLVWAGVPVKKVGTRNKHNVLQK
jgi:putative colanic acid biosynthesis acetyltransferase WcaF